MSPSLLAAVNFLSGLTPSTLFASWYIFGFESNRLISSSSGADLIMMPLFFKTAPEESTGLISMAKVAGLPLKEVALAKKLLGY